MARTRTILNKPEAGPLALLVGAIIVFTLHVGDLRVRAGNISNLLAFTPELGMIALAMTLLMTAGEFDLSVGSVFGFAAGRHVDVVNEGIAAARGRLLHRHGRRSPHRPRATACWSRPGSGSPRSW